MGRRDLIDRMMDEGCTRERAEFLADTMFDPDYCEYDDSFEDEDYLADVRRLYW